MKNIKFFYMSIPFCKVGCGDGGQPYIWAVSNNKDKVTKTIFIFFFVYDGSFVRSHLQMIFIKRLIP